MGCFGVCPSRHHQRSALSDAGSLLCTALGRSHLLTFVHVGSVVATVVRCRGLSCARTVRPDPCVSSPTATGTGGRDSCVAVMSVFSFSVCKFLNTLRSHSSGIESYHVHVRYGCDAPMTVWSKGMNICYMFARLGAHSTVTLTFWKWNLVRLPARTHASKQDGMQPVRDAAPAVSLPDQNRASIVRQAVCGQENTRER
jgi:hypothetical protein